MGDSQFAQVKPLTIFDAQRLQETDIPPLQFVVDGLLPEGLALLIAPPKYGKSWMAMQLCMAVARGSSFLGFPVEAGAVLYLALEDSARRLKERQERFLNGDVAPKNLYMCTEAATVGNGLEAQLEGAITHIQGLKLIVIDVLAKVRSSSGKPVNAYYSDYQDMAPLKAIADKHHVCILVLHHYRKSQDDSDFLNNASGSNGIVGSADAIIGINKPTRDSESATLQVTGRDIEMQSIPIMFDGTVCNWKRANAAADPTPPVLRMILHIMDGRENWKGTPAQILSECAWMPSSNLISNPTSIGKALQGLKSELAARNINFEQMRGKERLYSFYRVHAVTDED